MNEPTGPGESPPTRADEAFTDESEGDALARAMLSTFDGLVSSTQSAERIVSTAMALRAAQIDQLRVWSEAMVAAEGPTAGGGGPHGWTPEVRGRRELLFELACALRIPESMADRLLDESRQLVNVLPETYLALREGDISYRHAQVIVEQTATLSDEAAGDLERELLPFAKSLTVAKFGRVARKKREVVHPESISERRQKGLVERRVWLDPLPDGMAFLGAHLSAEVGVAAYGRLTEIARAQDAPGDDRTLAQKRADVLSDLLLDGDTCDAEGDDAGTGHGIRPKVLVTVPMLTLLGKSEQPANLEGYGPIDPEVARQLAADAPSFARVLTDPVTSAILDFDRTKYAVPADLRLVLRVRDEVCRAPGCNSLAVNCDVDHSVDFASGGTTCVGNLSHLCRAHHNLKHHTRVRLRNPGDGRIEWTTRAGRTYVTYPANTVGAPPTSGGAPPTQGGAPPTQGGAARAGAPPGDWPDADTPAGSMGPMPF